MSQEAIAQAIGVSPQTLTNWLKRQYPPPNRSAFPRAAKFFGVSEAYFENGTPTKVEGAVEESTGHFGGSLEEEARRLFEETLAFAKGNPIRLGYVIEQLRLHLGVPPHWRTASYSRPEDHPAVKEAMARGLERQKEFGDAGKKESGTPQPKAAS